MHGVLNLKAIGSILKSTLSGSGILCPFPNKIVLFVPENDAFNYTIFVLLVP